MRNDLHPSRRTPPRLRPARLAALALVALCAPIVVQGQERVVDGGDPVARQALRKTPAEIVLTMTPLALGDSMGGARLSAFAGTGGIASVGLGFRMGRVQGALAMGSQGFQFHEQRFASYGLALGAPLVSRAFAPRLSWTLGLSGAAAIEPRSRPEVGDPWHAGAMLAAPFTVRLQFTDPASAERRSAWRPAPAFALFAAPALAYAAYGERTYALSADPFTVRRGSAFLPALIVGTRVEGLGPLRLHLDYRFTGGSEAYHGDRMTAGIGIAIR